MSRQHMKTLRSFKWSIWYRREWFTEKSETSTLPDMGVKESQNSKTSFGQSLPKYANTIPKSIHGASDKRKLFTKQPCQTLKGSTDWLGCCQMKCIAHWLFVLYISSGTCWSVSFWFIDQVPLYSEELIYCDVQTVMTKHWFLLISISWFIDKVTLQINIRIDMAFCCTVSV